MTTGRIGVYICYCGGNISDCVDVEKVRDAVESEPGVVVSKTCMFACSDASQQEMVDDIASENLDGMVVASCSPKLHLFTFRGAAERAGLNPYRYVQVNLREQCSWAHTDDPEGATEKAIRLVRAGIARAVRSKALETTRLETVPRAMVIGAGVAGLQAALALDALGISVVLVERANQPGGWVNRLGAMYPKAVLGSEMVRTMMREVAERSGITLINAATVVDSSGSVGDFLVKVRTENGETSEHRVGAIVAATGFQPYLPTQGEYGYGSDAVVTLPEFQQLLNDCDGSIVYRGREVTSIAYIYCVGSRQAAGSGGAEYCSRYCCIAGIHASLLAAEQRPNLRQYHLYRDIRTYGKYETLYEQARKAGAVFMRFAEDDPPVVDVSNGQAVITVNDLLTEGEKLEIHPDLVVLLTGMRPGHTEDLVGVLKIPVGRDGFFNEVHPKLRPVETLIDGVFLGGACQGPKNCSERTASALAAAAKVAGLLKKGYVDLEPLVAHVDASSCTWCGACLDACPFEAVQPLTRDGRQVAEVNEALCKGCGACVAVCPENALYVKGYSDAEVIATIDALVGEGVS